jgi:hypothetical protein
MFEISLFEITEVAIEPLESDYTFLQRYRVISYIISAELLRDSIVSVQLTVGLIRRRELLILNGAIVRTHWDASESLKSDADTSR